VEDMRQDRMACVEAKQGAVAEHPSDGENLKTLNRPRGDRIPSS
jgi:hypothetical protein